MSKINKRALKKVSICQCSDVYPLSSPDGNVTVNFFITNGIATYDVLFKGETVILPSTLGLIASLADFSCGLTLGDVSDISYHSESYTLLSAKRKECLNEYNQRTFTLNKSNKVLRITFRAYNDGIAFSYSAENDVDFKIRGENSSFTIPAATTAWHNDRFADNYEFNHVSDNVLTLARDKRYKRTQIPLLLRLESGIYLQICESNLNGGYCGTMLLPKKLNDNVTFVTNFVKRQKRPVIANASFRSPWRYIVIGDEKAMAENTMSTNLADAPDPDIDYSYVKAGATAWSWLDSERPATMPGKTYQHDTEAVLKHIDLAAEMGWNYFIMDEGWQPKSFAKDESYSGYFPEFEQWRSHAEKKGVKLLAWCDCKDMRTPEKRKRLADWKAHGIAGIKVDFFDNENQETLQLYQDIYKDCALNGLIVIVHGANKGTGEERTYPNVLTREGIYGQEQGSVTAANSIACVFTRYAIGNTDFTEYLVPRENNVRIGFQLAMSFIYMSGVHCFADGVTNYRNSEAAQMLLKDFPSCFDEIRYIAGNPDDFVCLARRCGNTWYVAGISNVDKTLDINLDMLPSGERSAVIFTDGDDYLTLNKEEKKVSAEQKITVPLKKNGGFVIKID